MGILGSGFRGKSSAVALSAGDGIDITDGIITNTGLVSLDSIPDADGGTRGLMGTGAQTFLGSKLFNSTVALGNGLAGDGGGKPSIQQNGNLALGAFNNYIQIEIDTSGYGIFAIANANTIKVLSAEFDDPSTITGNYLPPRRINRSNTSAIEIQYDSYTELSTTIVNCTIAY